MQLLDCIKGRLHHNYQATTSITSRGQRCSSSTKTSSPVVCHASTYYCNRVIYTLARSNLIDKTTQSTSLQYLHAGLCGNLASLHTSAFNVITIFLDSNDNVTTPLAWACKRYDNEPVLDNEHLILQCI